MNSHERRTTERRWPYSVNINHNDELLADCLDWLTDNFGTCYFYNKNNPRWCFRPNHDTNGFAMYQIGAQIFFRKKEDYAWFLLKWSKQ